MLILPEWMLSTVKCGQSICFSNCHTIFVVKDKYVTELPSAVSKELLSSMSLSALTLSESCLTSMGVFWNSSDLEAGQQRAVHSSLISMLKHSPRILYEWKTFAFFVLVLCFYYFVTIKFYNFRYYLPSVKMGN